ncbi:GNAT family N-acetyltransferase [Streptococcus sp. DD12]|uniref:GNAT family N-acetyltransferase n=1 Tax=Streptococcus sp. DD12 TaxID=1777880 RepID=UPI00082E6317|nr:GNAT family N-acetyltransferase [Streptococcus sp. DD12]
MPIRLARPADIPALQGLLQQILSVHHQARPDLFKDSGSKYTDQDLADLMTKPETPIFVYEDEAGHVLGHLFITIKEPKDHGALKPVKTVFIEDLCVDSQARGQKIGDQLFAFAKNYAQEIGCYNLTLNVWQANAGALRFYQGQGMQPQETTMEIIFDH